MNPLYIWSKAFKKIHGKALKNCRIHETSKVEAGSELVNTSFERHSFCGYFCEIVNARIGSFCSIANNVVIGGSMHPMEWVSMSPVFYMGKDSVKMKYSEHDRDPQIVTTIGHDVWIGSRAIIKQGISIGTGAVVGMGSVVTKDVEPYAVVAGCPAKTIKMRFEKEIVDSLLASEWWYMSDDELKHCAETFTDPKMFLESQK